MKLSLPTDHARQKIVAGLFVAWKALIFVLPTALAHVDAKALSRDRPVAAPQVRAGSSAGVFDELGRLTSYPNKIEIACPAQTARTAVLLVAGQSNAANHASSLAASRHGSAIVNAFGGRCFIAQSPLLGASGEWGDPWTPLANRLVSSGAYDSVFIVPAAIGGSSAALWSRQGKLHRVLTEAVRTSGYAVTHAIWFQGESDYLANTSAGDYRTQLLDIIAGLRDEGVRAPVYVAVATRCTAAAPAWTPDNVIARVQRTIGSADPTVRAGVDADALLAATDRYDDCHLNKAGVEKLSVAWMGILQTHHAAR